MIFFDPQTDEYRLSEVKDFQPTDDGIQPSYKVCLLQPLKRTKRNCNFSYLSASVHQTDRPVVAEVERHWSEYTRFVTDFEEQDVLACQIATTIPLFSECSDRDDFEVWRCFHGGSSHRKRVLGAMRRHLNWYYKRVIQPSNEGEAVEAAAEVIEAAETAEAAYRFTEAAKAADLTEQVVEEQSQPQEHWVSDIRTFVDTFRQQQCNPSQAVRESWARHVERRKQRQDQVHNNESVVKPQQQKKRKEKQTREQEQEQKQKQQEPSVAQSESENDDEFDDFAADEARQEEDCLWTPPQTEERKACAPPQKQSTPDNDDSDDDSDVDETARIKPSDPQRRFDTEAIVRRTTERMWALGFSSIECGGGGDCFFMVLAYQLFGPRSLAKKAQRLRDLTCDEIADQIDCYKNYGICEGFVDKLKTPGTYVDTDIELTAASNALRVNLQIFGAEAQYDRCIVPRLGSNITVTFVHYTDYHYRLAMPSGSGSLLPRPKLNVAGVEMILAEAVQVVVCVLCKENFNYDLWASWSSGAPVGIIAHKSTRHELDIKNYTQKRVETAWGDASLVVAEQLLYREALARYPNATRFALVSESCIPTRECRETLDLMSRVPTTQSWMQLFRPEGRQVFSHQWKVLCRNDVDLVSKMRIDKKASGIAMSKNCHCCAPDEWIIPTHLAEHNGSFFDEACTWFKKTNSSARHPDMIKSKGVSAAVAVAQAEGAIFARKFTVNHSVLKELETLGILPRLAKEHICLRPSLYNADNCRGDFCFDISEDISAGRLQLYIYMDNVNDHTAKSRNAAGSARCWRYNRYNTSGKDDDLPRSAGISTGADGCGWQTLTDSHKAVIDVEVAEVRRLLRDFTYSCVVYSADEAGQLGSDTFAVGNDVKMYILSSLETIVAEESSIRPDDLDETAVTRLKTLKRPMTVQLSDTQLPKTRKVARGLAPAIVKTFVEGDGFIPDDIAMAWLHLVQDRCRRSCFLHTTQFFSRLVDMKQNRLNDVHEMKRWAELSADVLMNDLIFYPINLRDSIHWIFVMVDMVHHSITAFDSLCQDASGVGTPAHNAATLVREGLQAQAHLHAELQIDVRAWPIHCVDCPQQQNGIDCGVFMLIAIMFNCFRRPMIWGQRDMITLRQHIANDVRTGSLWAGWPDDWRNMADSPTIDAMRSDFGFAGRVDTSSLKAAALWLRQAGVRVDSGRTRVRTLSEYKARKASRRKRHRAEALGEAHGTQLGSTNEADLMLTMDVGCDTPIVAYDIGCGGGRIIEGMWAALQSHDRVIGFDCFESVARQAQEACKDYDNVFVQQANLFTIDVLPSATHLFCTTLGMDPSTCLHVLFIILMTAQVSRQLLWVALAESETIKTFMRMSEGLQCQKVKLKAGGNTTMTTYVIKGKDAVQQLCSNILEFFHHIIVEEASPQRPMTPERVALEKYASSAAKDIDDANWSPSTSRRTRNKRSRNEEDKKS